MVLAVRLYLQLTLRIWPCGENAVSTRLGGRVSLRSVVRQRQRPLLVVELTLQDTQTVVRQAPSIAPAQQLLVLRADQVIQIIALNCLVKKRQPHQQYKRDDPQHRNKST